ncbi:LPS export ABC transporter periplasmic protein LptC [Chryseosolibacter indicus]|nr:LPS export ABC transporter periplasmic protein LptC [Chryseosolibacter indicus]
MISGLSEGNLIKRIRNINAPKGHSIPMAFSLLIFLLSLCLTSCNQSEVKEPVEYTGPAREVEKMELFYSENDRVKVKMLADKVYEYENGDREFPKGIYLEFYDLTGKLESTLRANEAYYFKKDNQWRGRGKVEVKNVAKNEQLNTEELFWKPAEEKIFTEKFVTIRQEEDVIYGKGLDAKQDMSDYTILQPTGEFAVKE